METTNLLHNTSIMIMIHGATLIQPQYLSAARTSKTSMVALLVSFQCLKRLRFQLTKTSISHSGAKPQITNPSHFPLSMESIAYLSYNFIFLEELFIGGAIIY